MDPVLGWFESRREELIEWIRGLVEIESPSHDPAAVNRAADYVTASEAGRATVERTETDGYGDVLQLTYELPGGGEDGQILGLGHLDTVYPHGTLQRMPFRQADGRLWGPGVFDMKTGVAYFLFAVRALRELNVACRQRRFVLLLNPDEEVGSPASRPFTERGARKSAATLVTEGALGLDGKVKTARKGGGQFRIAVEGIAAHAGLDFEAGASAVVEIARQIEQVAGWTDLAAGVTINPGVVRGGTTSNVVAEHASCDVDVRVPRLDQAAHLETRFRGLRPFDPRTRVTVTGGLRRPPMERSEGTVALYKLAKGLAHEMGVELGEAGVGGGSDGNFTAALGVPTLDGLGAIGEGAHSERESILAGRMCDRAALVAKLLAAV
ncbi:MAG: M20/M25/M40 family metallo-hydrolase [Acidobacteria bacterium]|nr:M20/M25/M40 family metallo-hydrolase [Acidobacteriota bacterium]